MTSPHPSGAWSERSSAPRSWECTCSPSSRSTGHLEFLNYVSILLAVVMYAFVMSKFLRAYRVVDEVAAA